MTCEEFSRAAESPFQAQVSIWVSIADMSRRIGEVVQHLNAVHTVHRLSSHISSRKMCLQRRQTMSVKKTNVLLDEELVETAKELTGARFTKDVVDLALRRLVRNLRRRRILRLAGKVKWEGDLSAMRRGRRLA